MRCFVCAISAAELESNHDSRGAVRAGGAGRGSARRPRLGVSRLLAVIATGMLVAGLANSGCSHRESVPAAHGAAGGRRVATSPEKSFEQVADLFSRAIDTGLGGIASGFVSSQEGGRSRLAISNEVTHEFFPLTKEGETYRGVITVTSRYDYSLRKLAGDVQTEEKPSDQRDRQPSSDSGDYTLGDGAGLDIIDEDLMIAPGNDRQSEPGPSQDMIARRSDEVVKQYELRYENGRWVLKTELDPESERSIENAFQHALSAQP